MRRQDGITFLEVLVTFVLIGALVVIAVPALRHYWLQRTLDVQRDQVITQLRQQQEEAVSESHPVVFGARFRQGTSTYDLVKYDPSGSGSCTSVGNRVLTGGVSVSALTVTTVPTLSTTCQAQIPGANASDKWIFFYARGTANDATITFSLPGTGTRVVSVNGLTARVEAG